MNEKRKPVETEPDLGAPASRTRSDVAPKGAAASGPAPRHDSGFRPAVQIPPPPATPVDLEPADLVDDGWDDPDTDDSGETLLDMQASVPRELVAQVRAEHDPLGELDEPGADLAATREEDDREDFPTRETPHALEIALRAVSAPSTPKLPDVTAPMPVAPANARLDEILAAALPPTPRAGFFTELLPSDPPPARLILVAVLSFFGTLVLAAFVAWVVYLARH